jgi:RHS repeat-associated protein
MPLGSVPKLLKVMGVTNTYDADGRRVQQAVNGTITNYLWDETSRYGDVVLETDGNRAALANYTFSDTELVAQQRGDAISYYLHDGQGSVRALTDATGSSTDQYRYDAFGGQQERRGTTVNPYQYTGQQLDVSTGLYSLRARYYNPSDGRFLSRDMAGLATFDPVEWNRYGYARANPIRYSDPSGYFAIAQAAMTYQPTKSIAPAVLALGATTACYYLFAASHLAAIAKNGAALIAMMAIPPQPCSIPVFIWPRSTAVGQHIYEAQFLKGQPMLLHYDSITARHATRRKAATTGSMACMGRSLAMHCDEYPYASTIEGGAGASTQLVPDVDNATHGAFLGMFYSGGYTNHWGSLWLTWRFGGNYTGQFPPFATVIV